MTDRGSDGIGANDRPEPGNQLEAVKVDGEDCDTPSDPVAHMNELELETHFQTVPSEAPNENLDVDRVEDMTRNHVSESDDYVIDLPDPTTDFLNEKGRVDRPRLEEFQRALASNVDDIEDVGRYYSRLGYDAFRSPQGPTYAETRQGQYASPESSYGAVDGGSMASAVAAATVIAIEITKRAHDRLGLGKDK